MLALRTCPMLRALRYARRTAVGRRGPTFGTLTSSPTSLNGEVRGCYSPVNIVSCSEVALPPLPTYTTPPEATIPVYGP